MIVLRRITEYSIREEINKLGQDYLHTGMFFGNIYTLESLLNRNGRELYIAENESESYLLLFKSVKSEYRFLFREPSQEFLGLFNEQCKPSYIGSNLLNQPSKQEIRSSEKELVLDINSAIEMKHKSFRKKYNRALRVSSSLVITKYSYSRDLGGILKFLEEWKTTRSERLNQFAHIENDLGFLKTYGEKEFVKGVVIRNKDRVIAYNIFIPHIENTCISCYNKVLRGHESLGVLLTVEKCKVMKQEGYEKAYLGSLNNDFKKSLSWAGELIDIYSGELHYGLVERRWKGDMTSEKYTTRMLQ